MHTTGAPAVTCQPTIYNVASVFSGLINYILYKQSLHCKQAKHLRLHRSARALSLGAEQVRWTYATDAACNGTACSTSQITIIETWQSSDITEYCWLHLIITYISASSISILDRSGSE